MQSTITQLLSVPVGHTQQLVKLLHSLLTPSEYPLEFFRVCTKNSEM